MSSKKQDIGSISDSSSSDDDDNDDNNDVESLGELSDNEQQIDEGGVLSGSPVVDDHVNDDAAQSPTAGLVSSAPELPSPEQELPDSDTSKDALPSIRIPSNDPEEEAPVRRLRADSDLNKYKALNTRKTQPDERETPERWRSRLWPSKAITTFCRVLLRCKPPASRVGEKLILSNRNEDSQLVAHWKDSDLNKININFDSAKAHYDAFFLLAIEECRESVSKNEDLETMGGITGAAARAAGTAFDRRESSAATNRVESRFNTGRNGWFECEITAVVAESEFGKTTSVDSRLGSVWVVSIAIIKPGTGTSAPGAADADGSNVDGSGAATSTAASGSSTNTNTGRDRPGGNAGKSFYPQIGPNQLSKDTDFAGGDLMVMHSNDPGRWEKPVLSIIQPWDPDYDLKFGINFAINQSSHLRNLNTSTLGEASADGAVVLTTVNLLICVDHQSINASSGLGEGDTGGWAATGSIVPGVRFSMCLVGNVMTAIRECQALASLRMLNRPLQHAVLNAQSFHYAAHVAATAVSKITSVEIAAAAAAAAGGGVGGGGSGLTSLASGGGRISGSGLAHSVSSNDITHITTAACIAVAKNSAYACLSPRAGALATSVPPTTGGAIRASSSSSEQPSTAVLSPSALRRRFQIDLDRVFCPDNVPVALWKALSAQYNESQLRAIKMVCNRTPGQESSISLLQGPPGTGKTATILAIVSVFLAGALNLLKGGSTKVVAGSSFQANSSSRVGSKAPSGKYAYKHDMPTNAGYGQPQLPAPNAVKTAPVQKPRVLLCAPSNTAVDELVYRLVTQGVIGPDGRRIEDLSVVRIGNPNREEYRKINIQNRISANSGGGGNGGRGAGYHYNSYNRDSGLRDELTTAEHNMLRVVESATLDYLVEMRRGTQAQRDLLAANNPAALLRNSDLRKSILETADVVCCTLSGAGSQPILEVILRITGFKFDAVIIDEAAQAVEPSSLIPFKYNPQAVVMVGDPCQLPATVFSNAARKCNFGQSLFQRLHISGCPMLMLETQYRMHPVIAQYPSQRFYSGRLVTDQKMIDTHSHDMPYHVEAKFRPLVFHDIAYGSEQIDGSSVSNRDEALYILALYDELVTKYPEHKNNIGIIAPYRAQRRLLTNMFREKYLSGNNRHANGGSGGSGKSKSSGSSGSSGSGGGNQKNNSYFDTEISTVDGFQGREKNIIIFSCVRAPTASQQNNASRHNNNINYNNKFFSSHGGGGGSTDSGNGGGGQQYITPVGEKIGFLKEWQRLNVAITRAKYSLWIVGHGATLSADEEWGQLMQFVSANNYYYNPQTMSHAEYMQQQQQLSNGNNRHHHHHHHRSDSRDRRHPHHHHQQQQRGDSRDRKQNSGGGGGGQGRRGDSRDRGGNYPNKNSGNRAHSGQGQKRKHETPPGTVCVQNPPGTGKRSKNKSWRSEANNKITANTAESGATAVATVSVAAKAPRIDFKLELQPQQQLAEQRQSSAQQSRELQQRNADPALATSLAAAIAASGSSGQQQGPFSSGNVKPQPPTGIPPTRVAAPVPPAGPRPVGTTSTSGFTANESGPLSSNNSSSLRTVASTAVGPSSSSSSARGRDNLVVDLT